MAEERLIDDDKDRRYKIRKNADGEDELYIDDSIDETPEAEELFIVSDDEDEEELVMMPEQIEARRLMQEEAEKLRREKLSVYVAKAEQKIAQSDFYGAIEELEAADEYAGGDGDYYAVKLMAYSCNLTDFTRGEECGEAADGVKNFASEERKAQLKNLSAGLYSQIEQVRGEVTRLKEENNAAKSGRREIFLSRRNKALAFFAATFVPFAVFLILSAVFGGKIHAVNNDFTNLTLTIVFGALAGVNFIVLLVSLNKLWAGIRNVRLNESNFSTKLGREYEEKNAYLNTLLSVYTAFADYDIS